MDISEFDINVSHFEMNVINIRDNNAIFVKDLYHYIIWTVFKQWYVSYDKHVANILILLLFKTFDIYWLPSYKSLKSTHPYCCWLDSTLARSHLFLGYALSSSNQMIILLRQLFAFYIPVKLESFDGVMYP